MTPFRTPEDRFEDLPGFPFAPKYLMHEGLRIHYIDEGPPDAKETVLLVHGEPTWAYLYRNVIPSLATRHRVVAFDFVGFGRSDKLTTPGDYTYDLHTATMQRVLEALDLQGLTLVVHDWGGLVGLKVATELSDRIARLVVMNTFLPTGEEDKSPAFLQWRAFVEQTPDLPISRIVRMGMHDPQGMSRAVAAAYDAPFPDAASKAGAVAWPLMVPMAPDDPVADVMRTARTALAEWEKPALVLFADEDPILGSAHRFFRHLLPTAHHQPEVFIRPASHFLQEDQGPAIATQILDFIDRS